MEDLSLPGQFEPDGAALPDLELLIHATLNEKNAPEVLDYREGLTARLQEALDNQVRGRAGGRCCTRARGSNVRQMGGHGATAWPLALHAPACARATRPHRPPRAQEAHVERLEQDAGQELRRMVLSLECKRVRYLLKVRCGWCCCCTCCCRRCACSAPAAAHPPACPPAGPPAAVPPHAAQED